jgi:predicted nucleic acid-binding protein
MEIAMSNRRIVDTNIIVRYLVQDAPKHAAAANSLFDACDRGEVTLVVLPAVAAECVFVLESFYEHPRSAIAEVLGSLLASPGMELIDLAIHLDALDRYRNSKLHFVDCMIAATAAGNDVPVATFDREFKRFPDVRVEID